MLPEHPLNVGVARRLRHESPALEIGMRVEHVGAGAGTRVDLRGEVRLLPLLGEVSAQSQDER